MACSKRGDVLGTLPLLLGAMQRVNLPIGLIQLNLREHNKWDKIHLGLDHGEQSRSVHVMLSDMSVAQSLFFFDRERTKDILHCSGCLCRPNGRPAS